MHKFLKQTGDSPAFWVIVCVIAAAIAVNVQPQGTAGWESILSADDRPSLSEMNQSSTLLREGTAVAESKGKFQLVGDRIVFHDTQHGHSLPCLENLMLQRVESYLKEDQDQRQAWVVTGKVTEFNGGNYLWIDRAIRSR